MKKKTYIACLCTLAFGLFTTSCDDNTDDPKYRSLPPTFSDMDFKNIEGNAEELKAGDKIVATGVQQKYGRLLNKTTYNWKVDTIQANKPVSANHSFKKEVVYDNNSVNPTDTIVFNYPGTYNVTFDAKYSISAQYQPINTVESIERGSIKYSTSPLSYFVKIQKRITIK